MEPSAPRRSHSTSRTASSCGIKSAQDVLQALPGAGGRGLRDDLENPPQHKVTSTERGACSVLWGTKEGTFERRMGESTAREQQGRPPWPRDQTVQNHGTKTQFGGNRSEMTSSGLSPAREMLRGLWMVYNVLKTLAVIL